jgi:hypothetical protein
MGRGSWEKEGRRNQKAKDGGNFDGKEEANYEAEGKMGGNIKREEDRGNTKDQRVLNDF